MGINYQFLEEFLNFSLQKTTRAWEVTFPLAWTHVMWFLRTHFSEAPLEAFARSPWHSCRVPSGHPVPSAPQTHLGSMNQELPTSPERVCQCAADMPVCAWARSGTSQNTSSPEGAGWICPSGYVCLPARGRPRPLFPLKCRVRSHSSTNPTSLLPEVVWGGKEEETLFTPVGHCTEGQGACKAGPDSSGR